LPQVAARSLVAIGGNFSGRDITIQFGLEPTPASFQSSVRRFLDAYLGSGGAPEGVLAAAALRCIGGQMQGRLLFRNDDERARAKKWGVTDLNRKYGMLDMAKGDVMFAATGVTDGAMLRGVRRSRAGATTHSMVMRSKTGTVRIIEAQHNFERKVWVLG
jgi:fructose-1,6-bisphosphatase II / sedoheptulose-1,7-bisphosphatase